MKKVIKSEEEWGELLTHKQFVSARTKFTEPPYTNEFALSEKTGLYRCVCCNEPLFDSSCKIESKSGWPCFFVAATPQAVGELPDDSYGLNRTQVICNCCDANLGHVYEDGPPPTGLRYCINSLSLTFEEREEEQVQQSGSAGGVEGWQPEQSSDQGGCGGGSCGCK